MSFSERLNAKQVVIQNERDQSNKVYDDQKKAKEDRKQQRLSQIELNFKNDPRYMDTQRKMHSLLANPEIIDMFQEIWNMISAESKRNKTTVRNNKLFGRSTTKVIAGPLDISEQELIRTPQLALIEKKKFSNILTEKDIEEREDMMLSGVFDDQLFTREIRLGLFGHSLRVRTEIVDGDVQRGVSLGSYDWERSYSHFSSDEDLIEHVTNSIAISGTHCLEERHTPPESPVW